MKRGFKRKMNLEDSEDETTILMLEENPSLKRYPPGKAIKPKWAQDRDARVREYQYQHYSLPLIPCLLRI